MPIKKYNWAKLKQEYLYGDWITVRDFCIAKGMPDPKTQSHIAKNTAGWSAERKKHATENMTKLAERVFEEELNDTKRIRIEQAKKARLVKQKALDFILNKANQLRNVEEARKLYETAARLENEALGITEKTYRDQNNQQIIINPTPLIESLDAKGLADLINRLGIARQQHALAAGNSGEAEARPTPLTEIK